MTSTSSTGGRAAGDGWIYRLPGVPEETARRVAGVWDTRLGRFRCRLVDLPPEEVQRGVEAERTAAGVQGAVLGRGQVVRAMEGWAQAAGAGPQALTVLLSDWPEENNWFSFHATTPHGRVLFVHTDRWEGIFPGVETWVPVAHLVASGVLHSALFPDMEGWRARAHEVPQGCLMDLCMTKSQIRLKMLTADLCPSCARHAREAIEAGRLERDLLFAVLRTLGVIRSQFIALERESIFQEVGRVRITAELRVELEDWGELPLDPRDRAVYIALLRGERYRSEPGSPWQRVHAELRARVSDTRLADGVLSESAFNQSVARIRRALRERLPEAVAVSLLWPEGADLRRIDTQRFTLEDRGR